MPNGLPAAETIASADEAAVAALRELPEALVLAFDRDLRFILTAGQALERLGNPRAYQTGEPVSGAFPAELWRAIEPLCRSAIGGETRSREIWTADEHCLMVDVGPLWVDDEQQAGTARASPAASRS